MTMTLFVMYLLIVGATSAIILSAFLLFLPSTLGKMNVWASTMLLSTEQHVIRHPHVLGILMLVFGVFLSYVIYSTPLYLGP